MKQIAILIMLLSFLSGPIHAGIELPRGLSEERLATEVLWEGVLRLPPEKRPEITLVLGGGGAWGLSHIGVLRVIEQERIPIDRIIGVSVGALIGALYAGGKTVNEIEQMATEVGWNSLTDFSRLSFINLILNDELLSTQRMETYLNEQLGDVYFKDLKIPFTCIATDLRTGDRVIFREGPVAIAARASATVPGVFHPVAYRQRFLVDGGLVDNLPTELAEQTENSFILGIEPKGDFQTSEDINILNTLMRSLEIQREVLVSEKKKKTDFIIEPDMRDISIVDLGKYPETIQAGTVATRKKALELKQAIIQNVMQVNQW